ncbi:glycosyltransferase [Kitasatospora mediocidica]|uniref:glycosyltransferase n=1 Tax=Kitasatospora mediocidica TaxID=58352 RepID=UPI00055A8D8A|nr:glycosyltransferase [Kitasatospora mediocidica]
MRILFTFIGGSGHFNPLVPIAHAAEAAGHTVAVAGSGSMVSTIEAAGFTAFATSEPRPRPPAPERVPLEPVDPEGEDRQLRDGFAGRGARRYASVIPDIVRAWQPDVLVRDEVDFGTAVAAELLGLPCATVLVLAAGTFLRKELVADPLHQLRSELGLPSDPALTMLDRGLVLSPFPPNFRSPDAPLPATTFSYRPTVEPSPGATSRTPTVYFTLGTVYNDPDLHTRVLAGLRDLPADIVMTVGEHIDPAEFGPQPGRIRIERFIPQDEVLPHCDLVISHGGSGSLMGTLAHGLPSVLLPMGADQPHNARRCVELGMGRTLDPVTVTPETVRDTVSAVLADHAYRHAAGRVRDEINALPGVEMTVPQIERLHQQRHRG